MKENTVITSTKIKAGLFYYYRTKKQYYLCATEAGSFKADFLTINNDNQIIEVEIKISVSDLKKDFEKPKHNIYKDEYHTFTPAYFFYCVPTCLVEDTLQLLEQENLNNYGILVFRQYGGFRNIIDSICQMKSAIKLTDNKISEKEKNNLINRMSYDLLTRYDVISTITPSFKMQKENKLLKHTIKKAEALISQYKWCEKRNCDDCIWNNNCRKDKEIARLTEWYEEAKRKAC